MLRLDENDCITEKKEPVSLEGKFVLCLKNSEQGRTAWLNMAGVVVRNIKNATVFDSEDAAKKGLKELDCEDIAEVVSAEKFADKKSVPFVKNSTVFESFNAYKKFIESMKYEMDNLDSASDDRILEMCARLKDSDNYYDKIMFESASATATKRGLVESNEKTDKNPLAGIRNEIELELQNGEKFAGHIEYKDGKLIAGGATNTGILPEYSIDYDWDMSVDANLNNLCELILGDLDN